MQIFKTIGGDLINIASHTHEIFRGDSAELYYKQKYATRIIYYSDLVKSFQREKDACAAYRDLTDKCAGMYNIQDNIKRQDTLLHTCKWKVQYIFTLERFFQQHQNTYVSMQVCTEHVRYQLPNKHTRVGYVLDANETSDAPLFASI